MALVTSGRDAETVYATNGQTCTCQAGLNDDPVCKHRALLRERMGMLRALVAQPADAEVYPDAAELAAMDAELTAAAEEASSAAEYADWLARQEPAGADDDDDPEPEPPAPAFPINLTTAPAAELRALYLKERAAADALIRAIVALNPLADPRGHPDFPAYSAQRERARLVGQALDAALGRPPAALHVIWASNRFTAAA